MEYRTDLILPESIPAKELRRWKYVHLYSFSRNYFSKVAQSKPAKPAWKQNLTRNSRSGSFKVMHFGITEKPTTNCVSLYNNAGLISKDSEKNSQRKSWKLPFSTTKLLFDAFSPGNLHEYRDIHSQFAVYSAVTGVIRLICYSLTAT